MKSLFIVSLFAFMSLVACSHDDSGGAASSPGAGSGSEIVSEPQTFNGRPEDTPDLPNLSKSAGDAAFQSQCANPISVNVQPGETEVVGGFRSLTGQWQLDFLRDFLGSDNSDPQWSPGTMYGEYGNGRARILCHNTLDEVSSDSSHTRSLNGTMNLPYAVDVDRQLITTEATLLMQARKGAIAAQLQLVQVEKPLPAQSNSLPSNVQAVMVKTADGRIVLRFIMKLNAGTAVQTYAIEATYKRKMN